MSSHHALDSVVSGATMSSNSLSSPVDLKTDVLGDQYVSPCVILVFLFDVISRL